MPKIVYLADLVYDTIKSNYVVPLNIAYIAASLASTYGKDLEIRLFKYPTDLEKAIHARPPDVLGLSHYSWNSRLNNVFLELAKRLDPNTLTVMGGPNIRTTREGIASFLAERPALDYYILYEGERPFTELMTALLGGRSRPMVAGCATLNNGRLLYDTIDFKKKNSSLDFPSPYLTGWLDDFLADRNMIPLLETNRGCPFGCVYCTWGIAALAKIRVRPLEVVLEEIDYIAEKSVGQPSWIICDANFGILERDVLIAEKLRDVLKKKGFPASFEMLHAKNAGERSIKIAQIINADSALYAIQSTDPVVLANSGRGNISMESIRKQLSFAKQMGIDVSTDILIGLPGETADSHLKTIATAFDLGFDTISPYNIRLLPGSEYETDEYRMKYGVMAKYRPIFGAYGVYNKKIVVEVDESVRATTDISESELNDFKIHHWLIYFAWNMGFYKPLLRLGLNHGVNPAIVFDEVSHTSNPLLQQTFKRMKEQSMAEWFDSPRDMVDFYEQPHEYQKLLESFTKLNYLYLVQVYQNPSIIEELQKEIADVICSKILNPTYSNRSFMDDLVALSGQLICRNPLEDVFCVTQSYPGNVVAIVANDPALATRETVNVEIYRPEQYVSMCHFHLMPSGKIDLSVKNFVRFLEIGIHALKNKIRICT